MRIDAGVEWSQRVTPTTTATFDESALVEKARAGDAQAFTELVNHYERKIYRLAKHILERHYLRPRSLYRRLRKHYSL